MATSNSTDFSLTRAQIISRSLRLLGQLQSGESPSTEETTDANIALNAMVKRWHTNGIKLWKVAECVLFLEASQNVYQIGGSSTDHVAYLRIADVAVKTEVATAAVSGATSLVVDSISGIAASDKIGVVVDDGTTHWTTVNGAPSGTTIPLTTGLDDDAAVDNHVYAYTTDLGRPMQIIGVRRRDDSERDTPVELVSRQEWQDQSDKTSTGKVVQVYANYQLSATYLHCWPTPDAATDRLIFTAFLPLEDFDAAGNTPDFPQEWYDALCFNLAVALAPEYGIPGDERLVLAAQAKKYLRDAENWDEENEPIYFAPDMELA